MRLIYIIKNKKLIENDGYIYNIYAKKGDYLNPGTLLYTTKDLTKGKLEIFISINDIDNIKNKNIFINDERTNLKINKIYKISDSKNISSYKVEIIIPNPKKFSKLVKINFKNI